MTSESNPQHDVSPTNCMSDNPNRTSQDSNQAGLSMDCDSLCCQDEFDGHQTWLAHRTGLCAAAFAGSCNLISISNTPLPLGVGSALDLVALILLIGSITNGLNLLFEHELFFLSNPHYKDCPAAKLGEIPSAHLSLITWAIIVNQSAPWLAKAANNLWIGLHVGDIVFLACYVASSYLAGTGLIHCFCARTPYPASVCKEPLSEQPQRPARTPDNTDADMPKDSPRKTGYVLSTIVGCALSACVWMLGQMLTTLSPFDILYLGTVLMHWSWLPLVLSTSTCLVSKLFRARRR